MPRNHHCLCKVGAKTSQRSNKCSNLNMKNIEELSGKYLGIPCMTGKQKKKKKKQTLYVKDKVI